MLVTVPPFLAVRISAAALTEALGRDPDVAVINAFVAIVMAGDRLTAARKELRAAELGLKYALGKFNLIKIGDQPPRDQFDA